MTLVDILNDLKAKIGPGNYATDSQLISWINDSYLYMCDQIVQDIPDYFTTSDSTDLIANQFEYWLPSTCERIVMVNVNYNGTWRHPQPLLNIGQIPTLADITQMPVYTEVNPVYYITGNKIGILPYPVVTEADGLKLWFIQTPTALTANDTPVFNLKYHGIIKQLAYADYLDLDDQHQAAEIIRNRAEQRIEEMVETLSERQIDQPKAIEVVVDTSLYVDTLNGDNPL